MRVGRKTIFFHGENNCKGVAVLVKQSSKIDFGNVNIVPAGGYCFAEIKINDKNLVIKNIYAPTKEEPAFLVLFFHKLQTSPMSILYYQSAGMSCWMIFWKKMEALRM